MAKLSGLLAQESMPVADPRVVHKLASQSQIGEPTQQEVTGRTLSSAASSGTEDHANVPVNLIDRGKFQPRTNISEDKIIDLAASIEAGQLYNPVTLRMKPNGRYELVAGERRWLAHQFLERDTIPARVINTADRDVALLAAADNTAREDVSDYELGKYFKMLIDEKFVKNVAELVKHVALSRAQVDRCLDYLRLPGAILTILDGLPTLFGANTAEIFAKFCADGKENLVVQAVEMMRDRGIGEQQAVSWIKTAIKADDRRGRPRQTTPLAIGGRTVGEARIEKTKVIIACARDVDPQVVLDAISGALNNSLKTQNAEK